ncbi:CopD family protein [Phenylobacterium sp. LjRoot225]|uniref:CopD family protein n=1 Tax=Phenylobacterium sp. LjRoot225 TaxID=3342285 RepID=UPI003ECDBB8E
MADWPLLIGRFGLLTLAVALFGGACFPLYAPWTRRGHEPTSLRVTAPATAAVAGVVWLLSLWAQTPARPSLVQFCLTTVPGGALSAAVGLCLVLVGMAFAPPRSPRVRAYVTGALLASLALVGHAATIGGVAGAVRVAVMALHLLFAGAWLGGLLPLIIALRTPGAETERLLRAFGKMAIGAVAALATTGLVIAAVVVSLAGGPPGPTYLMTFGVKLALVLCLGVVAGVNRWAVTPLSARNPAAASRALWWTLGLEQLLALALLITVAQLGLLDPAAF